MKPVSPMLGLGLLLAASPAPATGSRLALEDARPLMLRALDAADGRAQGVLVGDSARSLAQHFQTSAPVLVDVVTLRHFSQPGCRRLQVTFRQEGVRLPGADLAGPRSLAFCINFCRDGQPPRSLE